MIREEGGKWVLYSHDGMKKLGTHASKAEAEAQERAIQAQKHMAEDDLEVEVFAAGHHAGVDFTDAHLDQIVTNFNRLREYVKPPVKLGHSDNQILSGQTDGDPALGWVSGLRRQGGKLLASVRAIPTVLRDAIRAGLYRRVSSELYPKWEGTSWEGNLHTGTTGPVLSAVAFLGAQVPEVKNLEDLGKLLHCQLVTCAETPDVIRAEFIADPPARVIAGVALSSPDKPFPRIEGPMAETPKESPKPTETPKADPDTATRLAELEAKLAEERTQREAEQTKHAAELAKLKAENEAAHVESTRLKAIQFVEGHQKADGYRITPAQAPVAQLLWERLARADVVIEASEAADRKVFAEGETPIKMTGLDLFARFIDKGPDHKAMFQSVSRHTEPQAKDDGDREWQEVLAMAEKNKLDITVYADKQKAAKMVAAARKERQDA